MSNHLDMMPAVLCRRGFFWIGIDPVETAAGTVSRAPMYVEWLAPQVPAKPYPVVLIHGGGGQGTDWLGTPDGRPGWAVDLVNEGYAVYVVDRVGHGRSPADATIRATPGARIPYEFAAALFAGTESPMLPGSGSPLHTQWPKADDGGRDTALDQLVASACAPLDDVAAAHALDGLRCAQLLEKIGPAIVFTHSAGGPAALVMADHQPDKVKALVAIEIIGPPFASRPPLSILPWGLTAVPLAYDPPVTDPGQLQDGTPRKLSNLTGFPIAVISAEASPVAPLGPPNTQFLQAHGCRVEHIALQDHGVRGNGHGMMMETNSRQALQVILDWMAAHDLD